MTPLGLADAAILGSAGRPMRLFRLTNMAVIHSDFERKASINSDLRCYSAFGLVRLTCVNVYYHAHYFNFSKFMPFKVQYGSYPAYASRILFVWPGVG